MSSGYTCDIADGKDVSFKDFALKCARAFGACIEQRDDDLDDKPRLIEKNEENNYHIKRLEEAKMWKKPTVAEFDDYVSEQITYNKEQIDEKIKLKARYEHMLSKVNKWVPPTPEHYNLKKFMIEQLTDSIKFDCDLDYYERMLSEIADYTYERYVVDMCALNKRNIEYHTEQLKKDNDRIDTRNEWISALYKSLEN